MSNISQVIRSFRSTRKFGIELEFFGIARATVQSLLAANGIDAYCDYSESNTGWKVTYDSSIRTRNNDAVELVSPILEGAEALRQVAKVVKIMAEAGARVNKSCGFHVHVDARDLTGSNFTNIVKRYAKYEDKIDAFMVNSRRGSANTFCKSTLGLLNHVAELDATQPTVQRSLRNISAAMDEFYEAGTYQGGRYYKVNMCAFLRHGTIEFRHHSGTMNPSKVINWIAFCVNFFENSLVSDTEELFAGMDASTVAFFNDRVVALAPRIAAPSPG